MSTTSKAVGALVVRQWSHRGDATTSPERRIVWSEPRPKPKPSKVCVVYYLCRNGQLEHPHFMELTLSNPNGLYLTDVMKRLDVLRGKGFANAYSWSVKRSYKNGFVWQDLSEDDLIVPTLGHDYVLKGSERIPCDVGEPSLTSEFTPKLSAGDRRHRGTLWSSFDLSEYKVYKADLTANAAVNVATQTDDRCCYKDITKHDELESEEISPPPSSSSPDTVETVIKPDGRIAAAVGESMSIDTDRMIGSGRMRASNVLMQLISCGSINVKDPSRCSPVHQFSGRLSSTQGTFDGSMSMDSSGFSGVMRLEDKEYFSGSLIETKKKKNVISGDDDNDGANVDGFAGLKRSSSYNTDRISKLDLPDKEADNVGAKCIPRKTKILARKESTNAAAISRSSVGSSKRIDEEPIQTTLT